ncbi:MAG: 5-oxoprolinase subunit PxpB [Bacillota bacterium]
MKFHRLGDAALLVETGSAAAAQELRRVLLQESLPGLRQLVPGMKTLMIAADPLRLDFDALAKRLPELLRTPVDAPAVRQHEIAVRYDGADLEPSARRLGIEIAELVRRHTAPAYTVAFLGFAPGFPYLTGLDSLLHLPRRTDPRTQVPAGSVAVAGEFCGIYPAASPGGWNLLGRCDAVLFDPSRAAPTLLSPGDKVRFKALA